VERELQNLVMQILAEQRRLAFEELREQLFLGTLDLSGEVQVIQDLFTLAPHTLLPPAPRGLAAWLARLFGRSTSHITPRVDIPGVVAWLEKQTGGQPLPMKPSLQGRSDPQKIQSVP
jgi:hypothetical protein